MAADLDWDGMTVPAGQSPHAGRCWWGWGTVAELKVHAGNAKALGWDSNDGAVLGAGFPPLRPPTVAEAAALLPPPRLRPCDLPPPLRPLVTSDPFERLLHARGRDFVDLVRNLRGAVADNNVDLVAFPRTEGEVRALVAWASAQRNVALVPFGGGSSVVFGVEPPPRHASAYRACITLDLAKLNRVLQIDTRSLAVRVQAGVYGPALERALKARGLTLRHFPQSFEFSTVGGWLATRGGGHFATGPTHVDDFVQSVRVATPAGVTETRRLPASGAGPAEHRPSTFRGAFSHALELQSGGTDPYRHSAPQIRSQRLCIRD